MDESSERRSRSDRIAETRAKLITAAREAFATNGYADTPMDAVTASVGLTRGALYHHFGGKEGLLEAVIRVIDREMYARYQATSDRAPNLWAGFGDCCRTCLRMALEPEIQRIILRDAPAVLGERWRAIDAESSLAPMVSSLRQLMDEGTIVTTDPEALARLLNGALVDAALWIANAPDPGASLDQALTALDALLAGLKRD